MPLSSLYGAAGRLAVPRDELQRNSTQRGLTAQAWLSSGRALGSYRGDRIGAGRLTEHGGDSL
jgi:hypothetical protein